MSEVQKIYSNKCFNTPLEGPHFTLVEYADYAALKQRLEAAERALKVSEGAGLASGRFAKTALEERDQARADLSAQTAYAEGLRLALEKAGGSLNFFADHVPEAVQTRKDKALQIIRDALATTPTSAMKEVEAERVKAEAWKRWATAQDAYLAAKNKGASTLTPEVEEAGAARRALRALGELP